MKRKDVFELWRQTKKDEKCRSVVEFIASENNTGVSRRELEMFVSNLLGRMKAKWEKSKRCYSKFLQQNAVWLEETIAIPFDLQANVASTSSVREPSRLGRPIKPFEECTTKVKKRKLKELLETKSPEELALANEMSLRSSGKRDAAKLVKELSVSSPGRATSLKQAKNMIRDQKLTPEKALSLIIDAKLSVHQYNTIRQSAKDEGSDLFPPYYLVQKAKEQCYPPEDAILVTDTTAEVNLQDLVDLTAKRLCESQSEKIEDGKYKQLRLIYKWGCDGSSAQSKYKQILTEGFSDEHLFSLNLVPIRLVCERSESIVWQNPRPNSTRFCRPVRFTMTKETKEVIRTETQRMQKQIQELVVTNYMIKELNIKISHNLIMTMIDGKVCSSLSQYDSSQKCYICGATPTEMNRDSVTIRNIDEDMYSFGISPLHSWIRAYECFLHISYKLEIKKWQARTAEEKDSVGRRKLEIQEMFRKQMGLLVDMPKQSVGNTNDGNSARRFFRNSEVTASITGIDVRLIGRFLVILEALSCDSEIDPDKFKNYAEETKSLYLSLYPWYYMPASIHKILVHGEQIIKSCILPLGQLAEEAQEANNKEYRRNREYFSRKTSRQETNRDILNRFLIASDPLLSIKSGSRMKTNHLPPETLSLLKTPSASDSCPISGITEQYIESD